MKFKTEAGTRFLVVAGVRVLKTRTGERYRSDGKNLILETSGKKTKILGPIDAVLRAGFFRECEPVLSFPLTVSKIDAKGRVLSERYEIPISEKAKALKQLWPFGGKPPELDEERFDLHAGKRFKVGDFLVYREDEANFLVSPYYPEGGGTVIDWMPAKWDIAQNT